MTERELLARTAELAADYLETLDTRPVRPERRYREMFELLDRPLPEQASDPLAVVEELAAAAEPGLMAIGSGRWFGFVAGGALPASLASDWLVSAWDQNTGLAEPTPATSALEAVAGRWVLELLGLPARSSFAFVTGCQMAHVTCLAAARHAVYRRAGWDLPERGLAGAPPLRVVVGAGRHVTIIRALRLLGIGAAQEVVVPADRAGRMLTKELAGSARRERPHDRLRPGRARSTPARSTISRRSSGWRQTRAPGCTSTVRSASGRRRARRSRTSSPVMQGRTRGRPTRTSGSTSRTTAGSPSAPTPAITPRRWSTPRRTSTSPTSSWRATRWATARSSRAVRARCPYGRPSVSSDGRGSRRSSSDAAPTRGRSPRAWRRSRVARS